MNEYYMQKLEEGQQYQDFVTDKLYDIGLPIIGYSSKKYQYTVGENKCGFEIKFDGKFKTTGNLYIETAEKGDPNNENFISSGIYRNDNTWLYIIGDYEKIFILSKKHLRSIYEDPKRNHLFIRKEIPTSQGFLVPCKYAEEKLAIYTLNITEVKL